MSTHCSSRPQLGPGEPRRTTMNPLPDIGRCRLFDFAAEGEHDHAMARRSSKIPDRKRRRPGHRLLRAVAPGSAGRAGRAAAGPGLGCRTRASPAARRQRLARPAEGVVRRAAVGRTDAAGRQRQCDGPDERHGRGVLAVLRHGPRAGPPVRAVSDRSRRPSAVRALAAVDVPGAGRASRAVPDAVLHLRRRPRRNLLGHRRPERLPADRDPEPPVAPGPVVRAGRGCRQRRSHLLGSAHLAGGERRTAQPERPAIELRFLGLGLRRQQRGGDEGGGRPADRAGLRHRLPVHAHLLPAGRPRPLGERRGHRRDRQLPDTVVPAPARARHAAALLPRVPSRRPAAGRPAVVGDQRPGGPLGELRHPALRQPDRDSAL